MKILVLAAAMAAGVLAATPAIAGGHEWWRSCGGHAYEGCDGRERGPYARPYARGYYAPGRVERCYWHRRNFFGPGGHYIGSRTVWVCD